MSLLVPSPFQLFADRYGDALEGGYIYIGAVNQSPLAVPITAYWDSALTMPAAQPIRTSGGYPVRPGMSGTPANIFVPGPYSILIRDQNQGLVFSSVNPTADLASGLLTMLKTVDGSNSGLISEGLQSIEITDLNFDPTLLGMVDREVRVFSTSFGPANQPNNSVVDFFTITLTKVDATSFILSMFGRDLSDKPTGAQFTRYWTGGAWGSWRWFVDQYDFVVDSNESLNQLFAHVGGLYKRVCIKRGSWSTSTLSPTAGVFWNLDATGTRYIFAEKGSELVLTANYGAGVLTGIYHAALPTDLSQELFQGVKISVTNTANKDADGFYRCTNLVNCSASANASVSGIGYGFNDCKKLVNCVGTGISVDTASAGFRACTELVNCTGSVTGTSTGTHSGFISCTNLSNCLGTATTSSVASAVGFSDCINLSNCRGTGSSGVTGLGRGFRNCSSLTSCIGTGNGGSGSGAGYGFDGCTGVIGCQGVGLATGSGVGYGFFGCTKMQQNRPFTPSKTATYNTSFADSGAVNACADTAAGGYNS